MAEEFQWDPAAVIARAKELIHASNYEKVGEARAGVDAAIDEWVRATLALAEGSSERRRGAARVADAWGRYAQLEMELRQFKQATKVFESAVSCAVTRDATALWLQYAAFCVDRKKLSNARKVFARAIFAVPEAERGHVWTQFHAFVREHIDPNMTLEALQTQMQAALPGAPSARASPTNATAVPPPNDQQAASQSTEMAASVAQSVAVEPTDATTAVATPSPIIGGAEKLAEASEVTDEVVDADAPSTAQVSSADSSDVPLPTDDNTAEETAKTPEVDTATPEIARDTTVDTNADATPSASLGKEAKQVPEAPELVVDGDSALAFVDKTGQEPVPAELVKDVGSTSPSTKRAGPAGGTIEGGANKRAKLDTDPLSPTQAMVKAEPLEEPSDFLVDVPKTLPPIDGCPHLLFDPPTNADGGINTAAASELPNELVERLSDALSDSAVFEGVRELCTNQEQRDLDMLHRWQELVRMQMKERTDLFARQAEAEEQNGFEDTRGLIELKMKHLEQRHEFVSRCLTSQRQFIGICAMDRADSLRAQQISLVNMKVPEMEVTTDPARIELQRAIISVILEAEKLWRAERDASTAGSKVKSLASGNSQAGTASFLKPYKDEPRADRDSLDSSSSHSAGTRTGGYNAGGGYNRGNSMRGGRGGGYLRRDGGRGGFRRDEGRPYAGRGGNDRFRRDPRRDPRKPFYENRDSVPPSRPDAPAFSGANAGAPAPARFEPPQRPPRMQEEYDPYEPQYQRAPRQQEPPGYYQGQQPPPRQQQLPPPVQYAPIPGSYDAYGRLREALPPPAAVGYAPQAPAPSTFAAPDRYPQDPRRPRNDRYGGPPPAANGPTEWQRGRSQSAPYRQDRQEPPPQQYRRREHLPTADRVVEYSVGAVPEGEYRPPPNDPHLSRYGGGPSPGATGRAPPAAYAPQAPPPHQQQRGYPRPQDMGPGPTSHPPPYDAYAGYDYPPPQQQHLQPPIGGRGAPPNQFDDPRGFGGGRGGFAPQQQRQPYQQQQQPYQQQPPESFGYQSSGPRDPSRQGYGRGRGGGRRGGGPRQFRR